MRLLLPFALLPGLALAAFLPADRLADPAAEARAQSIGREVRCMVCQGQSIEDSDADLARDLRRVIRERLAVGDDDGAVRGFLHNRYGDFILLRPPFSLATALLWATPALAFLLGLVLVRRRRQSAGPAPLTAEEQARPEQLARR
ncbi:MAG: cytochrome c-type biogenesis protein CcmH [Rubritepida sp.]|nr:cytochrome c-type biogenesis protein CcmH [Rubritepida sp.]